MARSLASGSLQYLVKTGFQAGTFPITLTAWFRPLTIAAGFYQRIATWMGGSSNVMACLLLNYPNSGYLANQVYKGGTNALPSKAGVTANNWHHGAVVSTSTSCTVYLNGSQGSTQTYIDPAFTGVTNFYIGYIPSIQYYNGQVCEVGVYNAELSLSEINALYRGYTPLEIRPQSLVAYYPLGGHYGQLDLDRWKNKYDLSPASSPTWYEHPRVIYPVVRKDALILGTSEVTSNRIRRFLMLSS